MSSTDSTSDEDMSDETSAGKSSYPPPLIVEPTCEHKESWIILHGRGDKAASFARGFMGLLNFALPDGRTLQQHLPNVRFVFPTASHRRARVFNRATITQWFDVYSWNSTERMEWQVEGLRETTAWIDKLVRREAEVVGPQNVVVGGLSQGCASALIWTLLWSGEKIKCVFGMSGWLPFRHVLELYLPEGKQRILEEDQDVFEGSDENDTNPYGAAVKALCQELQLDPVEGQVGRGIPIFLGHGVGDNTVDMERGREGARCLLGLGCNVQWTEYSDLGHWFHGEELFDIVRFVERQGTPETKGDVEGRTTLASQIELL